MVRIERSRHFCIQKTKDHVIYGSVPVTDFEAQR